MTKAVAYKGNSPYNENIQTPFEPIKIKFPKQDIAKSAVDSTASDATIYTVPTGKVFVLEAYWLSGRNVGAVGGADASLRIANATGTDIMLGFSLTATQIATQNLTLPRGIIFPSGASFFVRGGSTDIRAWAGIVGYETSQENLFYLT